MVDRIDRGFGRSEKDKKGEGPLDYHQNVNTDYFEGWFEALCAHVQAKYGDGATYVMDGAKSHKRRKDLPPTKSGNIAAMKKWLTGLSGWACRAYWLQYVSR